MVSILINFTILLLLVTTSEGEPRNQMIQLSCTNQTENNPLVFSSNFINTTEKIGNQIQSSLFGEANSGTGIDGTFGLNQCYGDLSTSDCIICYDSAHYLVSRCFPYTGSRVYLDGCFMRFQNYSFSDEFSGPNDTSVCGNTTRKSDLFQDSVKQAVAKAVSSALTNVDFFSREAMVSGNVNESVYVLAQCWKTLNASSCRSCLESASSLMLQCLPWSEGRALNTGCFMRYSDVNFLNPVPPGSKNRGRIIAIITASVSAMVILVVALLIGLYIWRKRLIEKKRTGSYDAKKTCKDPH